MDESDTAARVADAIHDGTLRELLTDPVLPHDPLVEATRVAVAQIDATVAAERDRLVAAFATAGVTSATVDHDLPPRPVVALRATVDRGDADAAVRAVEHLGYRRLGPTSPGAWRAYLRLYGGCALVDAERAERRIEITWSTGGPLSGRFARLVVPDQSDFEAVQLSDTWWFAYVAVHVARLPLRLWRRRAAPAYLGPFLVTPSSLIEPMLRFADVEPGELVVDLGCGDGRILIKAAQLGYRGRGVESDPALVARARERIAAATVGEHVQIVEGDATLADLGDADVVVMFLPVATLAHLLPDVLARLRPGARLVVHEHERLPVGLIADRSTPIVSADGITVAHRWNR